jgi:hypothetical protein
VNRLVRSIVVAAAALFAAHAAFAVKPTATHTRHHPVDRYEITVTTVEADGTKTVQTRRLDKAEASTLFSSNGTSKGATDGAPPLPDPPLPGSVPVSTTRIDYHQEAEGWTRDTSYGRVPGGPWELMNDHLVRTGLPPQCNPNDDSCGNLPN